jgi:hypothetical protein
MTRYRVLLLALVLFLALAQACLAGPGASWNTMTFNRMSVADCVRWGAHALQQEGYSATPSGDSLYGDKGPHAAILMCGVPANGVVIVVATNGSSDDATRERQALENRIQFESRLRERDHRR